MIKFFQLPIFTSNKQKTLPDSNPISSLAPKVLTRTEDIEKIQPYLDKLKETINAKGINNIALTGSYGSGKSTIIKTFQHLHTENEYLNISLAAFNKKDNISSTVDSGNREEKGQDTLQKQKQEQERLLEVSILQQIIYHVEPSKIPESRFKRIINIPTWRIWLISTGFVLWVASAILLLKYDYLDKINPSTWSTYQSFDWVAWVILLTAFGGLGIFSKLVVRLFSNSKINKVNIKGELELGDNINKSVFNEHLEEILYFFERTKHNVVVIEDLDRFDSTDIFTKLREINILLNNSKLIAREINFIYAVGDDLFQDKKERVKFFDYIIPVIPFINSSNADEQLKALIKESGLEEGIFTREFMSDVITFIDDIDMRLLINIFHEFVIYRNALKAEFVTKPEELFSMVTYKNIEPGDFNRLNSKEGKLYALINNKKTYIEQFISKVDNEIEDKLERIEVLEQHSISDIRELRAMYVAQVLAKIPSDAILGHSIEELLDEDGFEKIIDEEINYEKFSPNRSYHNMYNKSIRNSLDFSFSEIENIVNPNYGYQKRVELLKDKYSNKIETLKIEIDKLRDRKSEVASWDLKQIFDEVDLDQYLNDFSNNGLLRSLILNGYINENYNDYISLFHEGSITKEDLTFERNVKAGHPPNFTYKLHKIEGLIKRIDLRYFGKECVLNFDLLDYLGANHANYSAQYEAIIRVLSNEREKSINFINDYVKNENRPIQIFIEMLTARWADFYRFMVEKSIQSKEKTDNFLRLILTYAKTEIILENQDHEILHKTISANPTFLSLVKKQEGLDFFDKISNILKSLDVKFESLSSPTDETRKLFDYAYQNEHYTIKKDNILQMLEIYAEDFDVDSFNSANYATVKKSGCDQLIDYIDSNLDIYIENIYLKIDTNTHEEEEYLIELLNDDSVSEKNKRRVLEKVETLISDISDITEEELWMYILTYNKIEASWDNIIKIYDYHGEITEEIIGFINIPENAETLSNLPVPLDEDKNGKRPYFKMWKDILLSPELSDDAFRLILNSSTLGIRLFEIEKLPEERLEIMLEKKKFAFENGVFDRINEIEGYGEIFLNHYKVEILAFDDRFTIDEEILTIIIGSKAYSTDEINDILGNLDISDWNSKSFLRALQKRLAEEKSLDLENSKIIEAMTALSFDLYNVRILNNYFSQFTSADVKTAIEKLENEDYQKYLSTGNSESLDLDHGQDHDNLFELMKNHNYISDKSKKIKNGYQIFKNKSTIML